MEQDLGILDRKGDAWTLTFTRWLPHPQAKVWRAVTEPEHLAAWFPQQIEGERRAGAALRFVNERGDAFDGEMVEFDPPSVMEVLWGTDRLRIALKPDEGGTLLVLTDTFGEVGKAARDAAGWHDCLDRLDAILDGRDLPAPGSRWQQIHAVYVGRLGPEASSIGPPAGWEKTQ